MAKNAERPVGLIAGGGEFPAYLLSALKQRGHEVVVVALKGATDPAIARSVDRSVEVEVGEVGKVIEFLKGCGVKEVLMGGYVSHVSVLKDPPADSLTSRILSRLRDRRADTLLKAAAVQLKMAGIKIGSLMAYLGPLVPRRGTLTRREPGAEEWKDVEFGRKIAIGVAGLDIGQTVAVKGRGVVAVEALEGTDAMIRRAGDVGGEGVVIVKVAKPKQDFRFDVPVIGPRTVDSLKAARASVLAVEAGRTILLDRERVVADADAAGIAIVAL